MVGGLLMPVWRRILIHHSGAADTKGVDTESIRRWHVDGNGWRDIGYHGVVEMVGVEYEFRDGRPLTMVGAHCPGQNSIALGLCLVGNFTYDPPPEAQIIVAAERCTEWCVRFGIGVESIYPHRQFRATECPGRVDMTRLRALVAQHMAND